MVKVGIADRSCNFNIYSRCVEPHRALKRATARGL